MEMTKALLSFTLIPAMLLGMFIGFERADAASAAEPERRFVSTTVRAAGSRTTELYRVPSGMQLFVTQACQEHPAMYVEVGMRGDRISYNGHGCTKYSPGYVVTGGETLNCVNKSGQERTCVLIGMLEAAPNANRGGAKIYDVDRELGRQSE
jgi:hypothetical protein